MDSVAGERPYETIEQAEILYFGLITLESAVDIVLELEFAGRTAVEGHLDSGFAFLRTAGAYNDLDELILLNYRGGLDALTDDLALFYFVARFLNYGEQYVILLRALLSTEKSGTAVLSSLGPVLTRQVTVEPT